MDSSMIRTYRNIADVARSISALCDLQPVTIDTSSTCIPSLDEELTLPLPPPIDDVLSALGLSSSLSSQLATVYASYAPLLKETSEANLRRMIYACGRVRAQLGGPVCDPYAIRAAVMSTYTRTLRRMVTQDLVNLCRSHHISTVNVSLFVSPLMPRQSRQHSMAFIVTNSRHAYPDSRQTYSYSGRGSSSGLVIQQSSLKLQQRDDRHKKEEDMVGCNSRACSFPARYAHSRPLASRNFLTSSNAFFPEISHKTGRNVIPAEDKSRMSAAMINQFLNLSMGTTQIQSENLAPPSDADTCSSCTAQRHTPHSSPSSEPLTPPILFSSSRSAPTPNDTRVLRRKLAPLPKRISTSVDAQTNTRCTEYSAPSAVSCPAVDRPGNPSSLDASHDISLSTLQPRRRKVAAFPRRRPVHAASADSASDTSASPPSMTSPCLPQMMHKVSRTPSLTSLSSCSDTPNLSDGFDTPPPSPHSVTEFTPVFSSPISRARDSYTLSSMPDPWLCSNLDISGASVVPPLAERYVGMVKQEAS